MGLFVNTLIYCNTVIAVILEMILENNPCTDFAAFPTTLFLFSIKSWFSSINFSVYYNYI